MSVSLFGTLPPLKAISVYCWWLSESLSRRQPIEFFTFRKLYPEWLYPGGTKDRTPEWSVEPSPTLTIHRSLTYYNPLSWVWSALKARGRLIHAQWWSMPVGIVWFVVLGLLRLRGRRILLTVHNVEFHEKRWYDRLITKMVFSLADAFCVHCEANAQQLADYMGIDRERIYVVPIPVYDQYCQDGVSRETARRRLGIEPDRVVFLLFGNHRDYKGTDVFLEATGALSEEQRRKTAVLIVGQVWGDAAVYDRLIETHGLEDVVHRYYEYVPMRDVQYYFQAADVVVLPYKHFAAQSGVGSLALAFGRPLLVTRVGGLPALTRRPEAVAEPDDVASLRDAVARLLGNPELLEQMAADSRELAAERTWDRTAERTLEVYRQVLDQKPAS
ncbi:MAG: glycosyltransferase family 4 protein [Candidatus Brocadiia bacterium]